MNTCNKWLDTGIVVATVKTYYPNTINYLNASKPPHLKCILLLIINIMLNI